MDRSISEKEILNYLRKYPFYFDENEFEQYDFMYMANLFMACVDNLIKYALPVEIEDFGENLLLDKEQVAFIKKLADNLKQQEYSE